jgi:26S proteasome regulatory subunit N9
MSTFVDATSGSVAHCHAMAEQFPELAELYYDKMALCCQQKLWHQLTLVVLEFMNHKDITLKGLSSSSGDDDNNKNTFAALYQHVILAVYKKLNPLALAQMASHVALMSLDTSVVGTTTAVVTEEEVTASKDLLEQVLPKVTSSTEATLYVQSKIALIKLQYQVGKTTTTPAEGDEKVVAEQLSAIKSTITTNAAILNQILPDTPEATIVHSAHYEMSMTYYKVVGPPEAFYDQAILYLNYYDVIPPSVAAENQVVLQRQHQLAVDLCLAALVGKGVYNLGQIVTNPLLTCLTGTSDAWLVELLVACSKGDVAIFEQLVTTTYASHISATPALMHRVQANGL